MSWTPERIAELEKLWAEGLSTAEIGRRMGVSKNAVVGKAHRLSLPGRQSPIDAARRAAPRKPAARKPKTQAPRRAPEAQPEAAEAPVATPVAAAKPAPQPKRAPRKHSGPSCQWPFGDPRLPGFHFCGAPAVPGKPYCDEHCAKAYNRVSAAQADARADREAA